MTGAVIPLPEGLRVFRGLHGRGPRITPLTTLINGLGIFLVVASGVSLIADWGLVRSLPDGGQ